MRGDPRNLLPTTGQTTPYGVATDRDDGEVQAGLPINTRFVVDDTANMIFDRVTGLTWVSEHWRIFPKSSGKVLAAKGNWDDASKPYEIGDLVDNVSPPGDDKLYIAKTDHTSNAGNRPDLSSGDSGDWELTVWTMNAASLSANTPSTRLWAAGLTDCSTLTYNGFSDWRLPNIAELLLIYNYEDAAGLYTGFTRSNSGSGYYMSSTTNKTTTAEFMYVRFNAQGIIFTGTKASTLVNVRPVRGGFHIPYA